jgi:hypothetical protein
LEVARETNNVGLVGSDGAPAGSLWGTPVRWTAVGRGPRGDTAPTINLTALVLELGDFETAICEIEPRATQLTEAEVIISTSVAPSEYT